MGRREKRKFIIEDDQIPPLMRQRDEYRESCIDEDVSWNKCS